MQLPNVEKWKVDYKEIGIYTRPKGSSSENPLPLNIPTLMPFIPLSAPTRVRVSLDSTCFINSGACKPPVSSGIVTQNFKFVQVKPGRYGGGFGLRWFDQGAKISLDVWNKNIDNITANVDIDESYGDWGYDK